MASDDLDFREQRIVYLVATSHLDTQWRWTIQDTIREYLPATLRRNFELFEEEPGYVLSFEGAFRYMLAREYFPREYAQLKVWVERGRWRLAGSMLDAPDVNTVSPESLLRHILYGNGFFEEEFGRRSVDIFLPDCFGFSHALPSVAAHCGLIGFSSQKFGRWMESAEIPFDLGVWEGPDGRGVIAALRPGGYGDGLPEDPSHNSAWARQIEASGRRSGVYVGYKYFGIGDRGGAVGPDSIDNLRTGLAGDGPLRVVHSGSDQLYRDLDQETRNRLPRHRGELLLPRHGSGCLTSQAALKRWNRRNEQLADAAERAASAASWLSGSPYPRGELREAWTRFLWHQMHDDLTGTSVPAAYRFTWNDEIVALNRFSAILTDAIGTLSRGLDTRAQGQSILVFNPLSATREDVAEVEVPFADGPPEWVRAFGPDGEEVPIQILRRSSNRIRVAFLARVPSVGIAVFEIRAGDPPAADQTTLRVGLAGSGGPAFLENEYYRAELDADGDLASVYDKRAGFQLLAAPARLELLIDRSTRWPAWEVLHDDLLPGRGTVVRGPAQISVVESGPARVTLEVRRRTGASTLVQRYRLAAGQAGERLEVDVELDWRTRRRMLKAAFKLTVASPEATYDLGLGTIARGNNTQEKYEVPAQQWADLSDGRRGVSILNDSKYGWDKPDDSTLRLTLVRSPRALRRFRHQGVQDFGHHRFRYALYGHEGDWSAADTTWQAARLNQPPMAFRVRRQTGGPLGRSFSFLSELPAGILLAALKRAEKSDELIVRVRETGGRSLANLSLEMSAPIAEAREVDGCERGLRAATIEGGRLRTSMTAYEPRTFAMRLAPPAQRLPIPESRHVRVPFNLRALSRQDERRPDGFDGHGNSFPAELWPARLRLGELEAKLGPADDSNCLACDGHTLRLPDGPWESLVLIANSIDGDRSATFSIGGQGQELTIQDWSSHVGSREVRRDFQGLPWAPPRPAFLKRDVIAWVATHRHGREGEDEPYRFCYLFRYALALPSGATELTLPRASWLRIFAVLTVAEEYPPVVAEPLYD